MSCPPDALASAGAPGRPLGGRPDLPGGPGSTGGAPALSPRDLELLHHLALGRSTAGIAAAMSISSNTARTRIRRVQRKLAVPSRRHAVLAARRLGLG